MHLLFIRLRAALAGLALTLVAHPSLADDTEIFTSPTGGTAVPNILLVLDTSGSMGSLVVVTNDFDPTQTYSGDCSSTEIYYRTAGVPSCSSSHFSKSLLKCDAANASLYGTGATGIYTGNAIRWSDGTNSTTTTVNTTITTALTNRVQTTVTFDWVDRSTVSNTTTSYSTYGITISHDTGTTPVVTGPSTSTLSNTSSSASGSPSGTTTTVTHDLTWQTAFTRSGTSSNSSSPGTPSSSTTTVTTPASGWTDSGIITLSGGGGRNKQRTLTRLTEKVTTTTTTSSTSGTTVSYALSDVTCAGDQAAPGTAGLGYPNNTGSTATRSEWTATKANSYWDTGGALQSYSLYNGNYLNYVANPPDTNLGTRLSIVKAAATNLLDDLSGVNVGLMRYSDNGGSGDTSAQGGMVTYPVSPIATSRQALKDTINSYTAHGNTPLSETLYEAYLYYAGGSVYFGDSSKSYNGVSYASTLSVASSRVGNALSSHTYKSPITASCQNNYIVYLTDGEPTQDNSADSLITGLPSFSSLGGACEDASKAPYGSNWGPGDAAGKCLAALAQYMNHKDLSSTYDNSQTVATYFIGFGSDFADGGSLNQGFQYLSRAALRGGGLAYSAQEQDGLADALKKITTDIAERSSSFSAPTVAVNAYNRTQTLNDLFVSVFRPGTSTHWAGNIKKYHVVNGAITDRNGNAAVDSHTGFFAHGAQSYWSPETDGDSVPKGGAASQIPNPSGSNRRNVYTYIGNNRPAAPVDVSSSINSSIETGNTSLTAAVLGIGGASDPTRDNLINWARGQDVQDKDPANGNTTETRHAMGDPVHARPAAVIYGGTQTNPDIVVFAPTNDGYLHAIAGGDNQGNELWSFVPQELLSDLKNVYANATTTTKHYSLDGDVKVLKYDVDGDGVIQPSAGDKVLIFFGQGRGGSRYYALDVTNKLQPKFMWSIGPGELPGIGQAWSSPMTTRVKVAGASQNSQNIVLLFGGGYDPIEDTPTGTGSGYRASDGVGNRLFMVDAMTGNLLWYAGNTSSANLNVSRMDHAIPSNLTVMDLDTDGYADRMYVGDLAGQLWRFDITNNASAANLVAGGVIASLGTHEDAAASHTAAENRRFYNAPDVAGVRAPGIQPFLNVAIGSGYRGHPLETQAHDKFYSVRDYGGFAKLTQAQYNALSIIRDSQLTNVTDLSTKPAANAVGWKLDLNAPSWQGEKVLVPSTTFQNQVLFTTYLPVRPQSNGQGTCSETIGANRAYMVNVVDGFPLQKTVETTDAQGVTTTSIKPMAIEDRYSDIAQSGIAPELAFLFPGKDEIVCMSGAEVLGICKSFNSRMKTYWRESGAE